MSKFEQKMAAERLPSLPSTVRIFRCHPGKAVKGRIVSNKGGVITLVNAAIIELHPKGVPDYCGWKTVEVTPDMVGKKIAVFLGEEWKATKADKMRTDQKVARRNIKNAGGIHHEVRHDGEVIESCGWREPCK